jgi:hypothetical protein
MENERELDFSPTHFTKVNTQNCSPEAKEWIIEKLHGRFYFAAAGAIAFEDPKEAIMCELTWG